eukprot:Em0013g270a
MLSQLKVYLMFHLASTYSRLALKTDSLFSDATTVTKAGLQAISAPQAHVWLKVQPSPKNGTMKLSTHSKKVATQLCRPANEFKSTVYSRLSLTLMSLVMRQKGQNSLHPLPILGIHGETTEDIAMQVDMRMEMMAAVGGVKVEEICKLVDTHITDNTEYNKGFAELLAEMYNLEKPLDNSFVEHTLPWASVQL